MSANNLRIFRKGIRNIGMRWREHWRISEDCFKPKKSLMYQLGSILPDWFNRHPIHRWKETKNSFLRKSYKVKRMREGFARDWKLGVLAHFICDYCCMAHNELYYDFYKHRVYEVLSQQIYEKLRYDDAFNDTLLKCDIAEYDLSGFETAESESAFKDALSQMMEHYLGELHSRIEDLECFEWYRDEKIICLDIAYTYALLGQFLKVIA